MELKKIRSRLDWIQRTSSNQQRPCLWIRFSTETLQSYDLVLEIKRAMRVLL